MQIAILFLFGFILPWAGYAMEGAQDEDDPEPSFELPPIPISKDSKGVQWAIMPIGN